MAQVCFQRWFRKRHCADATCTEGVPELLRCVEEDDEDARGEAGAAAAALNVLGERELEVTLPGELVESSRRLQTDCCRMRTPQWFRSRRSRRRPASTFCRHLRIARCPGEGAAARGPEAVDGFASTTPLAGVPLAAGSRPLAAFAPRKSAGARAVAATRPRT